MTLRHIALFLIGLILFSNIFAQHQVEYLVAVNLNENNALNKLKELYLPIYQQLENVVICGVSKTNVTELQKLKLKFKIIDESPWSEKYYLISTKKNNKIKITFEWGQVLYKNDESILIKTSTPPFSNFNSLEYHMIEIFNTPKYIENENIIYNPEATIKTSTKTESIISAIHPDSIAFYIQSLQDFRTRYLFHPNRDSVANWIKQQFINPDNAIATKTLRHKEKNYKKLSQL